MITACVYGGIEPPSPNHAELDPLALLVGATGLQALIVALLVSAAFATWAIAGIKLRQLQRWRMAEQALRQTLGAIRDPVAMEEAAHRHPDALGSRVLLDLACVRHEPDLLAPTAEAARAEAQRRGSGLMTVLASIGSTAPFLGLLGTVYGILDAFVRIGQEKSASLPVVAPAIGEALIVTALGLFAAIPAVLAYNLIGRRLEEQLSVVQGASRVWAAVLARPSSGPGPRGG
jgi:biopolymer transport protein TolQ